MNDNQNAGLRQPWLGIMGTVISVILSFCIMMWFKPATFGSWVTFFAIAIVPAVMIISLAWQNNYPMPASKLEQPLKGIYLFLIMLILGFIVAGLMMAYVGKFVTPPGLFILTFMIPTVPIALFLIICFQCWPTAAIKKHPGFIGLVTLALVYVIQWIIFKIFFNFSVLKGTPVYIAKLDPGGLCNFTNATAFLVTTAGALLLWVLWDFWPLSNIVPKSPRLAKQPVWGVITSIVVLVISYIFWVIFINGLHMDVTKFMVNIIVCYIFGVFVILLMLQTWPFQAIKQPLKGLGCNIVAVILAFVIRWIYIQLCVLITGGLPSGAPAYALEMWLASALLAITFPMMTIYSNLFNFWPFLEPEPKEDNKEI